MQKLFMLNSPLMLVRAKALAARLAAEPGADDRVRVQRVYSLLYQRAPDAEETKLALKFLQGPARADAGLTRWEQYAQILLVSNEMLYLD